MKLRILLFPVVAMIMFTCEEEKDDPALDLNTYATRFFEEAAKRGVTVPPQSSIPIKFVEAKDLPPNMAGEATLDPPTVEILETAWKEFTPVHREWLMFHELGHAALRRVHCDERLPNCQYKSLMFSANWAYDEEGEKRDWYIEELFNPNAPYPAWGGTPLKSHTELDLAPVEERPAWEFHSQGGTVATGTRDETIKVSGKYSMKIGTTVAGTEKGNSVAYWYLPQLLNGEIPNSATLTVSVKVKTNSLTGKGVWIWVRADPNSVDAAWAVTSDTYRLVQGTNDWIEISQKIHCYPGLRPKMTVFLGIDGTGTGDVWFDDIKVGYDN